MLAYRAPQVLRRTAGVLAKAGWDIFVHLDRKADRRAYLEDLGEAATLCRFVDDPIEIFWGGFSMVQAEVRLIEAAQKAGRYDRYVLISDDAMPIHPANILRDLFENNADFVELNSQKEGTEFHRRYTGYFFFDHQATAALRQGYRLLTELDDGFFDKMAQIMALRQVGKKALDVYWGSQFWSLTAETVQFVLTGMAADQHLLRSFEFSAIPDELLFQSLIGNRRADRIIESGPMYADWYVARGPRIYTSVEELPYDYQPCHAFLRKIAPSASDLIQAIGVQLDEGEGLYRLRSAADLADCFVLHSSERRLGVLTMLAPASVPGKTYPEWHPVENGGRARFRWTAQDTIEWKLHEPVPRADTLRIVVPLMMAITSDFAENCELTFGGQTKPVQRRGRALFADFEPGRMEEIKVCLTTPRPISPFQLNGAPDRRPLGIAVRLADD